MNRSLFLSSVRVQDCGLAGLPDLCVVSLHVVVVAVVVIVAVVVVTSVCVVPADAHVNVLPLVQ